MTKSPAPPGGASTKPTSTPASTRATFATKAGRGYTVVRNSLVQVRTGHKWVGSSLGRLVEARQPRALLAYLLLLMNWSWIERREKPLEADVWARALSPSPPGHPRPASAMTRVWNTLEDHQLIERSRDGHLARVEPRREDGRGAYARPRPDQSTKAREKFFVIPDAFWLADWHTTLTFPGIAVLLILLAETQGRDRVRLPLEEAKSWYGISAKTMQNGLADLRRNGLLGEDRTWVVSDLTAIGRKPEFYYWPLQDFSRGARQKLQRAAKLEATKRIAKSERATPKIKKGS